MPSTRVCLLLGKASSRALFSFSSFSSLATNFILQRLIAKRAQIMARGNWFHFM